jgi:hypothetical protein
MRQQLTRLLFCALLTGAAQEAPAWQPSHCVGLSVGIPVATGIATSMILGGMYLFKKMDKNHKLARLDRWHSVVATAHQALQETAPLLQDELLSCYAHNEEVDYTQFISQLTQQYTREGLSKLNRTLAAYQAQLSNAVALISAATLPPVSFTMRPPLFLQEERDSIVKNLHARQQTLSLLQKKLKHAAPVLNLTLELQDLKASTALQNLQEVCRKENPSDEGLHRAVMHLAGAAEYPYQRTVEYCRTLFHQLEVLSNSPSELMAAQEYSFLKKRTEQNMQELQSVIRCVATSQAYAQEVIHKKADDERKARLVLKERKVIAREQEVAELHRQNELKQQQVAEQQRANYLLEQKLNLDNRVQYLERQHQGALQTIADLKRLCSRLQAEIESTQQSTQTDTQVQHKEYQKALYKIKRLEELVAALEQEQAKAKGYRSALENLSVKLANPPCNVAALDDDLAEYLRGLARLVQHAL